MGEQAINYPSVLADLKARRDRLNHAIAAVEQIIGELEPKVTADAPHSRQLTNAYRKMTIGDAVVHFLRSQGQKQTTAAMVKGIRMGGINSKSKSLYGTIFNVLTARAKKTGADVVKIGTEWALTEWPPES